MDASKFGRASALPPTFDQEMTMYRRRVNKARSAKAFRKGVGKTRRENLMVARGGFRL